MKRIIAMVFTLTMAVTVFAFSASAGVPTNSFYADNVNRILYSAELKTAQDFKNFVGMPASDNNFGYYDDDFNILPLTTRLVTSTNNLEYYKQGDTDYHEYFNIVVTGDINGDGIVSVSDKMVMPDVIMNPQKYSDVQRNAADVDNDGMVSVSDTIALQRRIMNGKW